MPAEQDQSPWRESEIEFVYVWCSDCEEEYYLPEDAEQCFVCGGENIDLV